MEIPTIKSKYSWYYTILSFKPERMGQLYSLIEYTYFYNITNLLIGKMGLHLLKQQGKLTEVDYMFFEEFEIGQRFECEPIIAKSEEMEGFAKKYDPHPIHTDSEYATNTMFNGIISSGFLTLSSMWGQWIRLNKFGNEFIVGNGLDYVKFTAPVRENDVLTTVVEVVDLTPSSNPERGKITIKFNVTNQHSEVVLLTQIKVLLKTKATILVEQA